MQKKLPNILITGTPGCGKTQLCSLLKEKLSFKFFNVSDIVKEKQYYTEYDKTFDSYIIDEDRLLDELEEPIAEGGCIVDHHTCDFFPERFFQLVIVLRTDNTILYDRLEARGYSRIKLEENLTAEIMEVVKDQAESSYDADIVVELQSDTIEQMEENADRILLWIQSYMTSTDDDTNE